MATGTSPPLIEMDGITKRFGRVVALNGVDFELRSGEVMGLLGDNGSGKSTLVKTLVGIHRPDEGEIRLDGEPISVSSPQQARELGISTVYQDLALVDELSVAANLYLARYPKRRVAGLVPVIDWEYIKTESKKLLQERLGLDIDPDAKVEFLSGGERQAVAITRSLVTDPDIIIMDEPTSALSPDSAARVAQLIRTLNEEEGISIVIISHNLEEVFSVTDRITVIDNGNYVGRVETDRVSQSQVLEMMTDGVLPKEA